MTQTQREKLAGELAAAQSAAERSRANGESDAAEQAQIGRLSGELDRLNKINEEARPAVEAMERRQREQQHAEERAAVQRQNRQEREFAEDLGRHYRERLETYRLKGTPQEAFDKEVWPKLRQQYVAGEEDAVDRGRREQAADVF
ncbi:MAG: hypothetical protein H0T57_03210 [Rubrobacter sp.]|nr:hypothetical protein [Rubrobacter sp.]